MRAIDQQLLVEVLTQMARHYLEQQGDDAPAQVSRPTAGASRGQPETDRYRYTNALTSERKRRFG